MTGMGWFDWQFVVVSLAALWGGWTLLRPLLPRRGEKAGTPASPACARCASGNACAKGPAGAPAGLVSLGSGRNRS